MATRWGMSATPVQPALLNQPVSIVATDWIDPDTVFSFQDTNDPAVVTGYQIYSSTEPSLAAGLWPR